jgi:hypothetical protein
MKRRRFGAATRTAAVVAATAAASAAATAAAAAAASASFTPSPELAALLSSRPIAHPPTRFGASELAMLYEALACGVTKLRKWYHAFDAMAAHFTRITGRFRSAHSVSQWFHEKRKAGVRRGSESRDLSKQPLWAQADVNLYALGAQRHRVFTDAERECLFHLFHNEGVTHRLVDTPIHTVLAREFSATSDVPISSIQINLWFAFSERDHSEYARLQRLQLQQAAAETALPSSSSSPSPAPRVTRSSTRPRIFADAVAAATAAAGGSEDDAVENEKEEVEEEEEQEDELDLDGNNDDDDDDDEPSAAYSASSSPPPSPPPLPPPAPLEPRTFSPLEHARLRAWQQAGVTSCLQHTPTHEMIAADFSASGPPASAAQIAEWFRANPFTTSQQPTLPQRRKR